MSIPIDAIDEKDEPDDGDEDAEVPHAEVEAHAEDGLEARHLAAEGHVAGP